MTGAKSQSRRPPALRGLGAWLAAACLAAVPAFAAGSEGTAVAESAGDHGVETPVGRLDYRVGRGLHVGESGLTVGGFATVEAERLEDGNRRGALDALDFLVFFDPIPLLHVFADVDVSELVTSESGESGVVADPRVEVDRLFGDLSASDRLNLKVGQFLTPIGRWNPAPAEPLVWTASDPLIVENVFDDTVGGAMLWGSLFPAGGSLSYSLYGAFFEPIALDPDASPAEHAAGVHLEWASLEGFALGFSYLASEPGHGQWNQLAGFDALWRPSERVELAGEALFGEGTREEGGLSGLYAQAVVETVPTLYAVGRYERFDPPEGRGVDLFDLGLAWVPRPWLRLKADYSFVDHSAEPAEPGFRSSFSILF